MDYQASKVDKTFMKIAAELDRYSKVFRNGGQFERAVAEIGGDIAWFNDVRSKLDDLIDTVNDAHMYAMMDHEDMGESAKATGKKLSEGVLDSDDEDGFMARSQLYFLARDAITLHGIIDDRDDLEPWVQSKITQAAQGIDAVRRYTEYNAMAQQEPGLPEGPIAEADENGTIAVNKDIPLAGDSIWGDGDNPESVFVTNISMDGGSAADDLDDTSYRHVTVKHDGPWQIYTDTGFEAAISKIVGFEVTFTEQGMQEDGRASMEGDVNDLTEGFSVLPNIDRERYQERDGLEGPFRTKSGKVVYYDPREGAYYDPDTDFYLSYDEWKALDEAAPVSNTQKSLNNLNKAKQQAASGDTAGAMNSIAKADTGSVMYNAMNKASREFGKAGMGDASKEIKKVLPAMQAASDETRAIKTGAAFDPRKQRAESVMEDEERPYVCVHAKKGKYECSAESSYAAAKKAAMHWKLKSTSGIDAYLADKEHTAEGIFDKDGMLGKFVKRKSGLDVNYQPHSPTFMGVNVATREKKIKGLEDTIRMAKDGLGGWSPEDIPRLQAKLDKLKKQLGERKMSSAEKAKEERLKDKYDDSGMKDSMKDQYGDDWKEVYYATIRKKAMSKGAK